MAKKFSKFIIFHPYLLAVYPALFIYSQNTDQISFSYAILPILVLILICLLLFLLLNLFLKNPWKTSLVVSLFFLAFFNFGHLFNLTKNWQITSFKIGDHSSVIFIFVALLLIWLIYLIFRTKKDLVNLTKISNFTVFLLVVLALFSTFSSLAKASKLTGQTLASQSEPKPLADQIEKNSRPNIYYLIFDAYGRQDILKNLYGYDNNNFLKELERRGFYIARSAHSNYSQTILSLSASLNHHYLDSLNGREDDDRSILGNLIENNQVKSFLEKQNYQTISLASGYGFTEITKVDRYIRPDSKLTYLWNEFTMELYNLTPVPYLQKLFSKNESFNPYRSHADRILFNFRTLTDLPTKKEPFFVFSHIISPHPPFVFDKNGKFLDFVPEDGYSFGDASEFTDNDPKKIEEYKKGYIEQLQFVNKKILKTIDGIQAQKSDRPTVIILQGDHGPGSELNLRDASKSNFKERLSIFNAYYFSDRQYDQLYDSISPVNSFKVVFNKYFKTDFQLEEDKSYLSLWDKPYKFIDAANKLK